MKENFDIGHFFKQLFFVIVGVSLLMVGLVALVTLIGVIIAIPLFAKGTKMIVASSNKIE
ncbi:hypothetical protein [Listeria sp. PSOL-1]|uniref:hypothetical protein n=1 Tax=Listeria sp. PSOL-1 TaxID=1844999 RepID=UPI0013D10FAF|nr:hypothetical protein [Listeria sp. PSOL-1]